MSDVTLLEHPGLRLKVYRVNPVTLERSTPIETRVKPSGMPLVSQVYPPCECPRCGGQR